MNRAITPNRDEATAVDRCDVRDLPEPIDRQLTHAIAGALKYPA